MNEKWMIIGNAQNWGRGESFKEALANAIKSAGMSSPMTECHVYRVTADRDLNGPDLYTDDFGRACYATDVAMTKLPNWKVPKKLTDAYFAFDLEVEEFEFGPVFTKAFDE